MGVDLSWEAWTNEISNGVRSVPDDELERAARVLKRSNIVLTAGNGGSSSLASHAAQALLKPDYKAGNGHSVVCLTDNIATITAHANDGGWVTALEETAKPFLALETVLLLVSSSGTSENIVRLARTAKNSHCAIVALTGFTGGPLRDMATVSLHVNSSDYEVVEPVHDALLHRIQYHLRRVDRAPSDQSSR